MKTTLLRRIRAKWDYPCAYYRYFLMPQRKTVIELQWERSLPTIKKLRNRFKLIRLWKKLFKPR